MGPTAEPATVTSKRRVSSVWIIPGIAIVAGLLMVVQAMLGRDVSIEIVFPTAEGIEQGRTMVRVRNVPVGTITKVKLNADHETVTVEAKIERDYAALLLSDSQFWVVRPRVAVDGVSGLSTLLSGAYIALDPGQEGLDRRKFFGLGKPPATSPHAEGRRITLQSDKLGALSEGSPLRYRGKRVGRLDGARFIPDRRLFEYDVFIEAPFDQLVRSSTHFWLESGVSLEMDADGIALQTQSLDTILTGGITFDEPPDVKPGALVADGHRFTLFENRREANRNPYNNYAEYLLLFDSSVRGLSPGAPVEYRGLKVGQVVAVSMRLLSDTERASVSLESVPVPVLIRLYPGMLGRPDNEASVDLMRNDLSTLVGRGMRATAAHGNLLTGSLFVTFDFPKGVRGGRLTQAGDWTVVPTHDQGLELLSSRASSVMAKIDSLPLNDLVGDLRAVIQETKGTAREASATIKEAGMTLTALKGQVTGVLSQVEQVAGGVAPGAHLHSAIVGVTERLNTTMSDLQNVLHRLDRESDALVFGEDADEDLVPGAGTEGRSK